MTLNPPPRTPRARARSQVLHLKQFSILLPPLTPTTLSAAWHQQLATKDRRREGVGLSKKQSTLRALRTEAEGAVRTAGAAHSSPALLGAFLPTVLLSGSNLISHKHRAEPAALSTCVPQILWLRNLVNLTIISTNIFFTVRSVSFHEKLAMARQS